MGVPIYLEELVDAKLYNSLPMEHRINLNILYYKISSIRHHSRIPFLIRTKDSPLRGYRSIEDQYRVYEKKAKDGGRIFDPKIVPTNSMHCIGSACDIYDPDQKLQKWILGNEKIIETLDLYFEDFAATPTWTHCQIYPPGSGSRFFKP